MLIFAKETDDSLIAKVLNCEDFERSSGRFENIYGIDLIFAGDESIVNYFLEQGLAIEVSNKISN